MLKVSKKIKNAIEREFQTNDYTIIKRVCIHSAYKQLCVDLVVFRVGKIQSNLIMRYWGDDSYSITGNYRDKKEVLEEIVCQIKSIY